MFDVDISKLNMINMNKYVMEKTKKYREGVNYNAFYSAIVVNTNDERKLGRVQIRIPAIHGVNSTQSYYVSDSGLPWAKPGVFNASGNDCGQFLVPAKGTRVFVTFEYDDQNSPIYFGGIPTIIGAKGNTKDYNDNKDIYDGENVAITDSDAFKNSRESEAIQTVFKSFKGSTIEIDDKDGQEAIRIISADGQVFEMGVEDPEGAPLERRGDRENSTNPHRYIRIGNENEYIKIKDGKIELKGDEINIEDSGWLSPEFKNGWVNYIRTYDTAGYRKINSQVFLKGLIRNPDNNLGKTIIFTLPVGYRPKYRKIFTAAAQTEASPGIVRIDIYPDGNVEINSFSLVSGAPYTSLEGISFFVD